MYQLLVVMYLAATGCGLGIGAVDGPSRSYAINGGGGDWYKDSSGTHVDSSGQKWRQGAGPFLGYAQLGGGALVGFRRGIAWTHDTSGKSLESARSADYFLQAYWGALSLGVGLTSESGRYEVASGATPIKGDLEYSGWYIEPGYALYANGLIYLGAVFAYIDGETRATIDGRGGAATAGARGLRPGLRLGTLGYPVGPVSLKLSIDVRYLITPEIDGGGSYGGLSTAFALNFIL